MGEKRRFEVGVYRGEKRRFGVGVYRGGEIWSRSL